MTLSKEQQRIMEIDLHLQDLRNDIIELEEEREELRQELQQKELSPEQN
jgi:hypothetical protein